MSEFTLERLQRLENIVSRWDELTDKFGNLPEILIRGRLVEKVPTRFDDVDATDRLNDWSPTSGGVYVLIDDSGTYKWGKISIDITFT